MPHALPDIISSLLWLCALNSHRLSEMAVSPVYGTLEPRRLTAAAACELAGYMTKLTLKVNGSLVSRKET